MKIKVENVQAFLSHSKALKIDADTFKRLAFLETRGHMLAEAYCNGDLESDEYERRQSRVKAAVAKAVPHLEGKFFLNGDPRGYALKLKEEVSKEFPGAHRDWGGYMILAPEF